MALWLGQSVRGDDCRPPVRVLRDRLGPSTGGLQELHQRDGGPKHDGALHRRPHRLRGMQLIRALKHMLGIAFVVGFLSGTVCVGLGHKEALKEARQECLADRDRRAAVDLGVLPSGGTLNGQLQSLQSPGVGDARPVAGHHERRR